MKEEKTVDNILAGAFAGFIARLLTAPLDLLKVRAQLQFHEKDNLSVIKSLRKIVKDEGILSLWKGNVAATYLWIGYAMVQFSSYGLLKSWGESLADPTVVCRPTKSEISSSSDYSKLWKTFVLFMAGAGAGMISTISTYPFDIMRTQFALQVCHR